MTSLLPSTGILAARPILMLGDEAVKMDERLTPPVRNSWSHVIRTDKMWRWPTTLEQRTQCSENKERRCPGGLSQASQRSVCRRRTVENTWETVGMDAEGEATPRRRTRTEGQKEWQRVAPWGAQRGRIEMLWTGGNVEAAEPVAGGQSGPR